MEQIQNACSQILDSGHQQVLNLKNAWDNRSNKTVQNEWSLKAAQVLNIATVAVAILIAPATIVVVTVIGAFTATHLKGFNQLYDGLSNQSEPLNRVAVSATALASTLIMPALTVITIGLRLGSQIAETVQGWNREVSSSS